MNDIKVLIVEDNPMERELLKEYLWEEGYDVITAADGKEGLKMTMPEMSGLQLFRSIRKNPQTRDLPIIACTSKNQEIDRIWAEKQGINLSITQPFSKEEILTAVASIILQ